MKISLDYDLNEVSSTFEPLEMDDYPAKLEEPPEVKKSSTNKDMMVFKWTISEGEYEGRKLFDNVLYTDPNSRWKFKQYCELVGIEEGSDLDTQDFVGLEAILTVGQEPDKQDSSIIRNPIRKMIKMG